MLSVYQEGRNHVVKKNVTITFHRAVRGAYVKFFTEVAENEVLDLVQSQRYLNADGTPHKTPDGLIPFNNIKNVVVAECQ